jgi:flagellar hook assembly protein FlgD
MEVVNTAGKILPTSYGLSQNYPNPFNATTQISFSMVDNGRVGLKIYNIAGQLVKEYDQFMSAGYRSITWDGTNVKGDKVASGVYFYKLDVNGFSEIKKMTLLK